MAKIVLVDGSSYLFRAFHALPPLTNSKGNPTGAAYGVVNMLKRLYSDYQPDYFGVIFDAPGKTFRDDLYSEYKANREKMPEELRCQIQPLHEIVKALGYPLIMESGVEADDVIGTLAKQGAEAGHDVVISTGDKDMAQLVNEQVTLINTMSSTCMDIDGVVEKFGVRPDQIIDWLALVGDAVDNIPGVPKCGPKTATKWLGLYGSMQGVIDNADSIGGKIGEHLRGALPQLPLSYELATIKLDVDMAEAMPHGFDDLVVHQPDMENLIELYQELEFKTWLRDALAQSPDQQHAAKTTGNEEFSLTSSPAPKVESKESVAATMTTNGEYRVIYDQDEFLDYFKTVQAADLVAFDTETTSLNYMQAELVGVSFSIEAGKAVYVPVAHSYEDAPVQIDREWLLAEIKPWLEDDSKAKVGQHLKYDTHVLQNYGIFLRGHAHDTMLQSYVLNSTASRHDMDSLALKYLGKATIKYEDIAGKGAKQKTFDQIDLEQAGVYAAEDADITLQLHQTLSAQLAEISSLEKVYADIEVPLAPVLQRIERNGVKLDIEKLGQQSQELTERLAALELKAYEVAGKEFNLGSPKQLQQILFEELEIPVIRKTPKGQPSTAEDVLQELAENYELPRLIIEHRGLAKLKSTYTDKLPKQVDASTGRIHTSYHQAVAATGRLSSTDPNLQNIPIRNDEGRRIRQAFVAEPGYKILAADYSQIELRIMAHLSGDESLLTAFKDNKDVHKHTAAEVFGATLDEVTTEQRRAAKAINFGLIYGMSAFGLAKQLNVGRSEAAEYIDLYFARYPSVKAYMDNTREQAKEDGYVSTVFGRRLYLPEINARNAMRRQYAERTAINAPMQGTAADIIKRAMLDVDKWLADTTLDIKMIMQVHDELVFEVAEKDVAAADEKIKQLMANAAELDVPLLAESGVGDNWDEAH